ncbi:MAG: hypothetical protein JSV37_06930 [Anaerolineaceae bacterium]|nr:MAG: hypothetical protein JSV37_06930 [Anaerolineaceae bacterium]
MSDPLEESNEDSGIVDKIKGFLGLGGGTSQGESLSTEEPIQETIKEEGSMVSDPLGKITEGEDLIGKVRNFLAGFVGYVDRENRREADKILRETIAQRYEEQWGRISELQRQLVSEGQLELVDDLEAATIKLRAFVDRVKGASYGYAGFFDAVRIHSDELAKVYEYDIALLEGAQNIANAVDNVAASVGSDGLPAAIRNLTSLSQEAIDAYNRRDEVILTTGS